MSGIEARTRTVYFSPAANRHFMTMSAAANKEATAIMLKKYPTERADDVSGGWHFVDDDHLRALHLRVKRRVMSQFRRAKLSQEKNNAAE